MVSIRDIIKSVKDFYTPTYFYNILSLCVYRGFLGNGEFSGMPEAFNRFKDFHEYNYQGTTYYRKTLGLVKVIGEYLSKNIFAEFPDISIDNKKANDEIQLILTDNKFANKEKSEFETQLAVGARIIKPYIQDGVIKLDYITDPVFFVTDTKDGEVNGIVLISQRKKTEKRTLGSDKIYYYTRLEWHYEEDGIRKVKYELYKGENMGHFRWKCGFNKFYDVYGERIEQNIIEYKTKRPTFIYVRNPIKNNKDFSSIEGLSTFANSLSSLKSADEAFDAISIEIDHGRIRIFVPELSMDEVLDTNTQKPIRHFDSKKSIYTIYGSSDISDNKPEIVAVALRVEQQIMALNMNIDVVTTQVGITPGTLRFDGKSVVTATQVITEKSDTARTVKMYEQVLTQAYTDLFLLIKDMTNMEPEITGNKIPEFTDEDVNVIWKDNVIVDDEQKKAFDKSLVDDGYKSKSWYLQEYDGLEEKEADKMVMDAATEAAKLAAIYDFEDPTDDTDLVGDNVRSVLGASGDEQQVDSSYNGAQIKAAIEIVKEFAEGALSKESAISMLMEFLRIDQAMATKMLIIDKSNLDDDITPKPDDEDDNA